MTLVRPPVRGVLVRNPVRSILGDLVAGLPRLSVSLSSASIAENGGTVTGTVTRPVDQTVGDLVVTLASSDTSEATVPPTATILNGLQSVDFTVTILNENLEDGDQTLSISVSAEGFGGASASLTVADVGVSVGPLAAIQTAYQAGDFAAYWAIQDGIMYRNLSEDVTGTHAIGGGTAMIPDKAPFSGDETIDQYVARTGLTGLAVNNLPGFIGYQDTGTYEPLMVVAGSPKYLEQGNSDENLRIRSSTGFASGSTSQTVVIALRTTDINGAILKRNGANTWAGRFINNAVQAVTQNMGFPTYRMDGSSLTLANAQSFYNSGIRNGQWHVLTIEGVDLSGVADDLIICGFTVGSDVANMDGDIAYFASFPDDTTTRDAAEAEAADIVGITLA